MRHQRLGVVVSVALLAAAIGSGIGIYSSAPRATRFSFSGHPALAATSSATALPSIADVAERVLPSVVSIASTRRAQGGPTMDPFFRFFFGDREPPDQVQRGLGSGVVVDIDGRKVVITNNHVVGGADSIEVSLGDDRKFTGRLLGTDAKSDLAVIELKGAKDLRPLAIGDSARLRLGDIVLAAGSPFGLSQTVTMGIVSAKGRARLGIVDYEDFIQTDAAINPGNSGGALVDTAGQLVGINTAIFSRSGGYQGIGFAIPTKMALPIVRSLVKTGKVVRGYLGVMIQDAQPEMARALGLPHTHGALVGDVVAGGPAARAGLRRGDFIVKLDGEPIKQADQLRNAVAALGPKQTVTLEYLRGGKGQKARVQLTELPADAAVARRGVDAAKGAPGLWVEPLTPTVRERFKLGRELRSGVVVTRVDERSAAGQAGLRPGDVILQVNRVSIDSVSGFTYQYERAAQRVLLLVHREGATFFLLLPK
ncbi:MAG: DegQ family serine endoprotease [Proteobacteria bacterium]|nr:DegQ family serine endoprotease [Pseudomonadota bacterium]